MVRTGKSSQPKKKRGVPLSAEEAGRKGGRATAKRYPHDFYVEIGKKGGAKVKEAFASLKGEKKEE